MLSRRVFSSPAKVLARQRRSLATAVDAKTLKKYPLNSEIHGYVIDQVVSVPEFALTAVGLSHKRTGAKHLHIDRKDSNNVFSIVFKTNPPNSTGLPHILEHTTLCGSEKYPVRDPFFKMLNRSLSNFMNAMTGHDYTFYPFSTTNKVDFQNLMNVYLDATLNPLLKAEDFFQEGWRLENEETGNKDSPLIFKGVVYNEMKGQMSDSGYYFWIRFQESIYPSLKNSGGDPAKMTELQYEDLLDFHSRYYHPSNSFTYTYGNQPLGPHLEKIDKEFIPFGQRQRRIVVKEPIKLDENKSVVVDGPVDPMLSIDQQHKTSLTWYVGKPQDLYESFLFKILSTVLMEGHSSPLYQKLIESGIGTDYSINSGMESMTGVNLFTIGLQGLNEESSETLQDVVFAALKDAKKDGVSDRKIKAIIHQIELARRVDSASFGMNVLSSIVPGWVNNIDPIDSLSFNSILTRFNEDYKEQGDKLITNLIDRLLETPYFKYTMKPSEALEKEIIEEEKSRLETKISALDEDDKDLLYKRGLHLAEKQNEKEDLSCLPSLSVTDINREGVFSKINHKLIDNKSELQTRLSPKTNGLTYFRGLSSFSSEQIPKDLIKYLPLFSDCLTSLGTKSKEMSQLDDEIKLYTGGLNASTFVHASPTNIDEAYLKFSIGGVSLDNNFEKMLDLWKEILLETNFKNIPKLSTLIKSLSNDNISDIISSGHSFARGYSSSKLSPVFNLEESLNGIGQVQFLSELSRLDAQNQLESEVVPKLELLRDKLLESLNFKFNLTCGRETISTNESTLSQFIGNFSNQSSFLANPYETAELNTNHKQDYKTLVQLPSQVSFAGVGIRGLPYVSDESASLQILSQILTFKHLHREVREKGGAYGGGATYDALNGMFNYYSYRDPKPFQSLSTFDSAPSIIAEKITDGTITAEDLEQAKLTLFQKIDAPISVRQEGMTFFNYGIDEDMRQERREKLLDVDLDDVQEVSSNFFENVNSSKVLIGSAKLAEETTEKWDVVELK